MDFHPTAMPLRFALGEIHTHASIRYDYAFKARLVDA